jgi:hypothetical protein
MSGHPEILFVFSLCDFYNPEYIFNAALSEPFQQRERVKKKLEGRYGIFYGTP